MEAYAHMAAKGGLTLAEAAEVRFEYIEQQLAHPELLDEATTSQLLEERGGFGVPDGATKMERKSVFNELAQTNGCCCC